MTQSLKREMWYKKVNQLVTILYFVVAVGLLFYFIIQKKSYNYCQAGIALILLMIPTLVNRLSKIKITSDLCYLYYLFCFFTIIAGSLLGAYAIIPYWDKILHFSSGILITFIGMIVFQLLSGRNNHLLITNMKLIGCFSFFLNAGIAAFWEIYEYGLYVFLGVDALNMETSMAHDTLQDIIVCIVGGALVLTFMGVSKRCGKSNFFLNAYEHFLVMNGYKENKEQ